MTIKNIVIGTGGINVFQLIGAMQKLLNTEYIKQENIENIYCTSAGSIVGLLLCLNTDWDDILDYIINNPWDKTFENVISTTKILSALNDKGIIDGDFFHKIYLNIFKHHGINKKITLKELYDKSKIKINIFVFNITTFKGEVFNYINTPDLPAIEAIYASCALPFIFKPLYYNNNMYVDGGLKNEYPLNRCIEDKHDINTILGIKISDTTKYVIKPDDNIISLLYYFIRKFIINNREYYDKEFENEIVIITSKSTDPDYTKEILSSKDIRLFSINEGKEFVEKYLLKKLKKKE